MPTFSVGYVYALCYFLFVCSSGGGAGRGGVGFGAKGIGQEGTEGSYKKTKNKKTCQRSEAAERILSDVITTCALYTPLVSVFSRGWSATLTAVRCHLRVKMRRLKSARAQGFAGWVPVARMAVRMA